MTRLIKRIENNKRFSQATVFSNTIYLTGQVALDDPSGSLESQVGEVLQRIDALLEAGGTSKSNLLMTNIWLRDMKYYDRMNAIWDAWVDAPNVPARACVQAELVSTFKVEISVIAALPNSGE